MDSSFTPTRTAALEQLSAFLPHAGRSYAARRNFDLGPGHHVHVSTLSPYLRCRLITEEEVLQAVAARHSLCTAEKFIQEVFWRTYWKGWLEQRPGVWMQYQQGLSRSWDHVQTQSGLRSRWEAACKGTTGIDCFDAWAQELSTTGYLHNHARMWFASIWIFTLELPWELGADFFLRHLLDGDPASNTLGWRWVAGIQTPGKTYLARTNNISKFTEGRFHPKWQLSSEATARPAPPHPPLQPLPIATRADRDRTTGFVLHEDDLSLDFALQGAKIASCALLASAPHSGPLQPSPRIAAFRNAALQETAARWSAHLGPVTVVQDATELVDWARAHELEQVVTPYAPVGGVATILAQSTQDPDMPPLHQAIRPYDGTAWPHATRGFFAFKKHIPALLDALHARPAA